MKRRARKPHLGVTATEVLVAAGLMVSVMGFMTSLTFQTGNIVKSVRHYQVAIHELANQLELLTSLNEVERKAMLENLKPSDSVMDALPEATISGEVVVDSDGTRLVLSLDWDRGANGTPVRMVAWVDTKERKHD